MIGDCTFDVNTHLVRCDVKFNGCHIITIDCDIHSVSSAREFAQAILMACDKADELNGEKK